MSTDDSIRRHVADYMIDEGHWSRDSAYGEGGVIIKDDAQIAEALKAHMDDIVTWKYRHLVPRVDAEKFRDRTLLRAQV